MKHNDKDLLYLKLLAFLPEFSVEEDLDTTLEINNASRGIILADFAKLGRVDPFWRKIPLFPFWAPSGASFPVTDLA